MSTATESLQRYEFHHPLMGTEFKIVLYAADGPAANQAAQAAFERVGELNRIMSDYDPESEINLLAQGAPHSAALRISEDLLAVLNLAHEVSTVSGGAFDVTIGPFTRLWRRAKRQRQLPDPARLKKASCAVGYEHLKLAVSDRSVQMMRSGMRLDLGGIAKGYATDQALKLLRARGFDRALVDGGGDMSIGAPPPHRVGWAVAVAGVPPDGPPLVVLSLQNCGIATSGDAWQAVEIGKRHYSHIVDPHSGIGLTHSCSVSIIAKTGIMADAMASAVSVMGSNAGMALINRREYVEGVIVTADDVGQKIRESEGFADIPIAKRD